MRIKNIIILTRKLDSEPTRTFHLTTEEKELKTATKKKNISNFPFKLEGLFFQIRGYDSYLDVLVPNTWLKVSPDKSDGNWGESACQEIVRMITKNETIYKGLMLTDLTV